MTLEPVVGVVFGRSVVGKMTLSYICLPFHSPAQASQLTGTSSNYRFWCHYHLITYLIPQIRQQNIVQGDVEKQNKCNWKTREIAAGDCSRFFVLYWHETSCFYCIIFQKDSFTSKSLSEALIFASTNPRYNDRLFIE